MILSQSQWMSMKDRYQGPIQTPLHCIHHQSGYWTHLQYGLAKLRNGLYTFGIFFQSPPFLQYKFQWCTLWSPIPWQLPWTYLASSRIIYLTHPMIWIWSLILVTSQTFMLMHLPLLPQNLMRQTMDPLGCFLTCQSGDWCNEWTLEVGQNLRARSTDWSTMSLVPLTFRLKISRILVHIRRMAALMLQTRLIHLVTISRSLWSLLRCLQEICVTQRHLAHTQFLAYTIRNFSASSRQHFCTPSHPIFTLLHSCWCTIHQLQEWSNKSMVSCITLMHWNATWSAETGGARLVGRGDDRKKGSSQGPVVQ